MDHPAALLDALAEDYWQGVLRRNPILATFHGDFRYNDRLPDVGPRGRSAEQIALTDLQQRLGPLADTDLDVEHRITWDMLRISAQAGLDTLRLRLDEMAVDQMDGPQVWLPELLNWHPTDSTEHVEQLIARYHAFGPWMDDYLDNLRDGIRDGRTAPGIAVERVLAQLRALLSAAPESTPLAEPAARHPSLAPALQQAIAQVIYPAYQRMLEFLDDYRVRHARVEPGVWAVADGEEIYAILARQHTTTELSPRALHQIGLDDLEGIHAEMREVMSRLGSQASTNIREFTEQLTRDPQNQPSSRQDILEVSERLLAEAGALLPRIVSRLPVAPCVVKPVEEYRERDMPAAYYYPASDDGSRPGTFYVNTFEPSSRPRHTLAALAFHEGVPGHHLQIALAQETTSLPAFRRLSAGWLANAFVEGWALYTERLADELGLYPDDRARFGMLGYQAWRACRLVVDTGMHHLRWTRDQALEFFYDNVGLTQRETTNEVDRYIVWPGQALAYKVGQREIEAIRRQQQQRLNGAFDLRAFHDTLLAHAAVPLSTLPVLFPSQSLIPPSRNG